MAAAVSYTSPIAWTTFNAQTMPACELAEIVSPSVPEDLSRFEAILLFENGVTPDGRRVNDIAFAEFPDELQGYWSQHPVPERRVGKVFVTETGRTNPRWLVHAPIDATWEASKPRVLHTITCQLKLVSQAVRDHRIRYLGVYAVETDLLRTAELRGLLQAVLDPAITHVEIFGE